MNISQLHQEIKQTNLAFMQLSQQMIRANRTGAIANLGVSEEMADMVSGLSEAQIAKLSATNMFLCCFHFDEGVLLNMLGGHGKGVQVEKVAEKKAASELAVA